jgi:hypothetical protein
MCCFFAALLFFGPRLAFLVYWLIPAGRVKVNAAFGGSWLVPLLGLLLLPWMTLAYVFFYPIAGWEWILVVGGLVADIAGYTGGYRSRNQVPGYRGP